MEFLIVLASMLVLLGLLAWFLTRITEKSKNHLSSGKVIPDEDDLVLLCVDQLITDFNEDELSELADIAISHFKDEVNTKRCQWEDLLRRVQIASDEKRGIAFAY